MVEAARSAEIAASTGRRAPLPCGSIWERSRGAMRRESEAIAFSPNSFTMPACRRL